MIINTETADADPAYTVTFDGNAVTDNLFINQGAQGAAVFYAINPASTSGDVVVTLNSAQRGGVSVLSLSGVVAVGDTATAVGTATTTFNLSYDGSAGGLIVAGGIDNRSGSSTAAPVWGGDNYSTTTLSLKPVWVTGASSGIAQGHGAIAATGSFNTTFKPASGSNSSRNAAVLVAFEAAAAPLASNLFWAAGDGLWDVNTTVNWNNGSGASVYADGDTVNFEDTFSGTSPITVTLDITVSPSAVTNDSSKDFAITGTGGIAGIASLLKDGTGTLTLGTANTFGGTTTLADGTLQLANSLALQNSTLDYSAGTLSVGSLTAVTLGGLSGSQNLALENDSSAAVALTVGGNNTDGSYSGNLSGSGSLTKDGTGTLTLANANYTGDTTVNSSGTLTITGGSVGTSSSAITIGNGGGKATLNFSGSGMLTANTVNVAANGGSSGTAINITGGASAVFATLNLGGTGNTTGSNSINTAGSVSLGTCVLFKNANANGPRSTDGLFIQNGTVTADSLIIQGPGATGSGDLHISGGSLTIGNSSSTEAFQIGNGNSTRGGWLTMTGGALTYLGTDGLLMGNVATTKTGAAISGGTATLTGITLDAAGEAISCTLDLSGNGALYLGNVGLVVNPANTAPIPVSVGGTSTLGATTDWSSSAAISLTGTPVFKAADASDVAHNISLSGVLSGAGGVTKTGGGTLTLGGVNTYTGDTDVQAGALTLADNAQLKFVIGNNGVNNQIKGGGSVNLDGDFSFDLSGAEIADGNSWTIVDVNTLTETFGSTFQVLGSFSETSPGLWTYTDGVHQSWTFTEATGVLSLGVVNNAPVAQNITAGVTEGDTLTLTIIGGKYAPTDTDGDALAVTAVGSATSGTTSFDASSVSYTADGGTGTNTFTYTVGDPLGATSVGTVTVIVTAANNGANIVSGSLSVNGQDVSLQALGIPGATYRLQFADSLAAPIVWTDMSGSDTVAAGNGLLNFAHTASETLPSSGFFRTKYVSGP